MGVPVSVCLCLMERQSDEAVWFFDIARAGEEDEPVFAQDARAAAA